MYANETLKRPEVGNGRGKREGPRGGDSGLESSPKSGNSTLAGPKAAKPVSLWLRGHQEEAYTLISPALPPPFHVKYHMQCHIQIFHVLSYV